MKPAKILKNVLFASTVFGAMACADAAMPEDEAVSAMTPAIAANGDFRVATGAGEKAVVNVRSREFSTMEELYQFAMDEMGGTPVFDAEGRTIGVQGVSVAAGDVKFRDEETGETFEADDLAQAYLGGARGLVKIAGKELAINVPLSDIRTTALALTDNSEGCSNNGQDCVSGHSWKTNYVVYRSVGSETKQSKGGYSPYTYTCCNGGTLVTYQGRKQCRYVTEWEEPNPDEGQYKPIPVAYGYRPTTTCTGTRLNNSLTLGVAAVANAYRTEFQNRTEINTTEVSMSNWGVGVGVSFLGIDDVDGVCGFHSGSRGTTTRTRAGDATDSQCDPTLNNGGFYFDMVK